MNELSLAKISDKKLYASGEVVFGQGDLGDAAYIVEEGEVAIFQVLGEEMFEIGIIHSGEMFGEMSMIDGGRRMATAIARRTTVVRRIPKTVFDRKISSSDLFVRGILNFFLRHIRSAHQYTQVKPRSIRDQVRYLRRVKDNLRDYAKSVEDTKDGAEFSAAVDQLDAAVRQLDKIASRCPDSRHDVIMAAQAGVRLSRHVAATPQNGGGINEAHFA